MNCGKRRVLEGWKREMATLIRCRQVDQEIQHASSGLLTLMRITVNGLETSQLILI